MSQSTIVVLLIAIVAVLVIIGIVMAARGRGTRLRDLPPESKEKYATSWRAIETRFIESPQEAVREADRVAVGLLSERGASLHDERHVPSELREARKAAASDQGRQGTEGMRQAMVHYKRLVEDAVGDTGVRREGYRREVAS